MCIDYVHNFKKTDKKLILVLHRVWLTLDHMIVKRCASSERHMIWGQMRVWNCVATWWPTSSRQPLLASSEQVTILAPPSGVSRGNRIQINMGFKLNVFRLAACNSIQLELASSHCWHSSGAKWVIPYDFFQQYFGIVREQVASGWWVRQQWAGGW